MGADENGFVKFGVEVHNQDEMIIQTGRESLLIWARTKSKKIDLSSIMTRVLINKQIF